MSRYYDISLYPAGANPTDQPTRRWSSFPNGVNDPGALNVEFDFFSFQSHESHGTSSITIHGISLADLQQAPRFAGMSIVVKAGMQKGLPLANPAQVGVILRGTIWQSYGNWIGEDMTLDFVVYFAGSGNIVLNWPKGSSLAAALTSCLDIAYPKIPNIVKIGSEYVVDHDVLHAVSSFSQLAKMVKSSSAFAHPPGVILAILPNNTIVAYDGSTPPVYKRIAFDDLIGQPTWIEPNIMQFTTIMRGDIQVSNVLKMPKGLPSVPGAVTTTGGSQPSSMPGLQKYTTTFQGEFMVQAVRQIGNFRDSNGASWATIFRCAPQKLQ